MAALVQTHLYSDNFPSVIADDIENEYAYLCNFLGLHSFIENKSILNPHFTCNNQKILVETWLIEFTRFAESSVHSAKVIIFDHYYRTGLTDSLSIAEITEESTDQMATPVVASFAENL